MRTETILKLHVVSLSHTICFVKVSKLASRLFNCMYQTSTSQMSCVVKILCQMHESAQKIHTLVHTNAMLSFLLYVQLEACVLHFTKPVAIVIQQLGACRNVLSSIDGNSVITIHHLNLHSAVWLVAADTHMSPNIFHFHIKQGRNVVSVA